MSRNSGTSEQDTSPPIKSGRVKYRRFLITFCLALFCIVIYHDFLPLYTDWLWFGEVGYRNVFSTTVLAKISLYTISGIFFFAFFHGNITLARKMGRPTEEGFLSERLGKELGQTVGKAFRGALLGISLFLSLWAGRLSAEHWSDWLEYRHGVPFGMKDPLFGNDIGFYVFRLSLLQSVHTYLLISAVLTFAATLAIDFVVGSIDTWNSLPEMAKGVRTQLLALLGSIACIQAYGTYLQRYQLLYSDNGVFTGAGYADIHYRLLALNVEWALLLGTGIACVLSIKRRDFRWPIIGVGAWITIVIILGNIVPALGQKAKVEPDQFGVEREYIQRNIAFTRQGFKLSGVRRIDSFPADASLNAQKLQANRTTVENVRLWDYSYLGKVYSQLQSIKPYYKFTKLTPDGETAYNIDIDRYPIAGRKRQVMLGAREMNSESLPASAQTWQNLRFAYTHGYGVAMSPVNRIVDGNPDYFLSRLPISVSPEAAGLKVSEPDIYYGLLAHDYVFVDTAQQEFDYPSTSGSVQDHYVTYQGKGGIRIGDAPLAKLAFSLTLNDPLMLLQNGFKPGTRILYRRDVRQRVQTIAPFVQQDSDPYLVIEPDSGRLVWMIDCYTLSDKYPYSTPQELTVNPVSFIAPNYIRNSIKAVVDAYDGSVSLYLADEQDPIAQTYAKIYPLLLKPLSALPPGLRAHLRYPEDLFRLQRAVYAQYHVDDPRVFYLKEDAWAIPTEPNIDQTGGEAVAQQLQKMEPYYVIMRLPDVETVDSKSGGEEFLLMSPLAPINRESQNILGWMCARCDPPHYGELVLYRFSQSASVEGPSQIVQMINSDRVISPQLALLRSGGSTASLGNLLVVPIDRSLIYIAPLYVEATNSSSKLPQLQKVIVAFGQRVAMEDTLERALSDLFSGEAGKESPEATGMTEGPHTPNMLISEKVRTLIQQADTQYKEAQRRLKAGDFAGYGQATKSLEQTLNALRRAAGGSSSRSTP